MKLRGWWLVILALAVYAGVLYVVHPNPQATTDVTAGSSLSAEPMGDLAFARLWQHLHFPFATSADVPELLPTDSRSVFVSVEPKATEYTAADAQALLDYVRQGHQVVWVTNQTDALTQALKVNVAAPPAKTVTSLNRINLAMNTSNSPATNGGHLTTNGRDLTASTNSKVPAEIPAKIDDLKFTSSSVLTGSGLKKATSLLQMPGGATLGAVFHDGSGQITLWSVPDVFENQGIGQANNLQIAWHLIGPNGVLWDEYGHGVMKQGLWGTLFGHGRQGTLLLFLAAALAYVISGNTRFGMVRKAPDDLPRLDVEFVHAMTWHYSRRALAKERERLLDAAVRRRLGAMYGLSGSVSWDVLDGAVLPGLHPKLQQAYALFRSTETGDSQPLTRALRKRRLTALNTLMTSLTDGPKAEDPRSLTQGHSKK